MAAAKKNKSPGRQVAIQQILAALEKRYRSDVREFGEFPVLETLIYAICLEDSTFAEAELFYERIGTQFHDFNEARVSSITELSRVFLKSPSAEWKAFRLRNLLGHVFESFYAFDFDSLLEEPLDDIRERFNISIASSLLKTLVACFFIQVNRTE